MASASKDSKGRWRIRFYDGGGARKELRLTGMNQRQAESIARHCAVLNAARCSGTGDIDRGTALWLQGIGENLYSKLAAVGLVTPRAAAVLGAFLAEYVQDRPDTKPATQRKYGSAVNHLVAHFGENRDLRSITRGDADGFRAFLYRQGQAENTVRRYCGLAKQFFRAALRRRMIDENPFGDQVAAVRGNAAKFHFITREDAGKILAACPDHQWRMIFALCRWGGLRCPSEVLALKWEDIAWQERRFTVRSPKTEHHEGKGFRVVPLFPELAAVLTEGFDLALSAIDAAGEGKARGTVRGPVITRYREATQNLRTTFQKIVIRAGLQPWPKLLQNLRSTRETELAESFPLQAVTAWMGNSQLVAAKHYLQLRDEHFERAAGKTDSVPPQVPPQVPPNTSADEGRPKNPKRQNPEKHGIFRGSADVFASLPNLRMGDTGLEPPQQNTGESGDCFTGAPTGAPKPQPADVAALASVLAALPPDRLAAVLLELVQSQAGR